MSYSKYATQDKEDGDADVKIDIEEEDPYNPSPPKPHIADSIFMDNKDDEEDKENGNLLGGNSA